MEEEAEDRTGVEGVGLTLQVESIEGEALANLEEVLMLEVEVGSCKVEGYIVEGAVRTGSHRFTDSVI